jgi:DNA-binding transcriptional regulator LsrR (DeoR family)
MKPRRKEKSLEPQPEPSVMWVNTHIAGCLSGVLYKSAMQMMTVAVTGCVRYVDYTTNSRDILLIGANQIKMRCNDFVVIEQITPRKIRSAIDKRTVSHAVLETVSSCDARYSLATYGVYE